MAFDIDPTLFIDTDFFATTGQLEGVDVDGNFDQDYFEDVGGAVGVAGYMKTFEVATASVPAIATGQTLAHGGINYEVVGIQKDSSGVFTTLILMER